MSKSRPLAIALFVLGMVTLVGRLSFAGPCSPMDGMESTCANAGTAVLVGGVGLAACGLVASVAKQKGARVVALAVCVVLGVFLVLAPGTIFPLCMMATMQCRAVMQPFSQVMGTLSAVVALVGLVVAVREK